jgi:tetratricopeptide (TPR) repeat protein
VVLGAALALPPLALALVVRPQQGLVRDWDVFAFAGSALAAVAAWRAARWFEARPAAHALALPLALAAAWPALQWAALASDPPRLLARAESIYTGPPAREREERAQGLAWLGMAHYARGETQTARRLFERSSDVSPHPRMLVQWGILAQLAERPEEALGYFRRSAAISPGLAAAWQGIAETGVALGDVVAVREAVAHLERLEPGNAALPAARAWLGGTAPH